MNTHNILITGLSMLASGWVGLLVGSEVRGRSMDCGPIQHVAAPYAGATEPSVGFPTMPDTGGALVLQSGLGRIDGGAGDILLESGDVEAIRIRADGTFYVDGRHVADDALVYAAFRRWTVAAMGGSGR